MNYGCYVKVHTVPVIPVIYKGNHVNRNSQYKSCCPMVAMVTQLPPRKKFVLRAASKHHTTVFQGQQLPTFLLPTLPLVHSSPTNKALINNRPPAPLVTLVTACPSFCSLFSPLKPLPTPTTPTDRLKTPPQKH